MEEWRACPSPIEKYEVSSVGRVRNTKTDQVLKHDVTASGYHYFNLTLNTGKQRKYYAHKLEAQCFLPNPESHATVDHINQDKHDNRLSNLRWASNSEQMKNRRTAHTIRGRSIHQLTLEGAVVRRWSTAAEIRRQLKFEILHGLKTGKPVKGYIWQYADVYVPTPDEVWRQLPLDTKKPVYASSCGKLKIEWRHGMYRLIRSAQGGGYMRMPLRMRDGTQKLFFLHRLVALTFLSTQSLDCIVNHKDGNKLNNAVENLEYVTYKENSAHALNTGLITVCKSVQQLDMLGNIVGEFTSISEAARSLGLKSSSPIIAVLKGRAKTSAGHLWRYSVSS